MHLSSFTGPDIRLTIWGLGYGNTPAEIRLAALKCLVCRAALTSMAQGIRPYKPRTKQGNLNNLLNSQRSHAMP